MIWYAIRTSPQREFALAGRHDKNGAWVPGSLERKGYTVFVPVEIKEKRVSRYAKKVRAVSYPMFTGYIFVGGDLSWAALGEEDYVTGFVKMFPSGMPAPISDSEIVRIKAMSATPVPHRRSINPHRALRAGEMAEITVGPFAGQRLKVEGLYGRKARLFQSLFGAERLIEVPIENVEAA